MSITISELVRLAAKYPATSKPCSKSDIIARMYPNVVKLAQHVANSPACPQCGASMVMRTVTRGRRAGTSFWGCSRFVHSQGVRPQCMGTLPTIITASNQEVK